MYKSIKSYRHEAIAYAAALISLYIGVHYATFLHAEPLAAAGATVIVFGVLLGSSRKFEKMQAKVTDFISGRRGPERETVKSVFAGFGRVANDSEADLVLDSILKDAVEAATELVDQRKRLFKIHEVVLVCLGTLVNGFAPFIMLSSK